MVDVIGSSVFTSASLRSKTQVGYKITFHKDGQVGEKAQLQKQALLLVQSSFANVQLMKVIFGLAGAITV